MGKGRIQDYRTRLVGYFGYLSCWVGVFERGVMLIEEGGLNQASFSPLVGASRSYK